MKVCTKCKQELSLDAFPPDKRCRSDGKQARCRSCIKEFVMQFYRKYPAHRLIVRARVRAKKKGFEFNITKEDILPLPKICPVLGIKLRATAAYQDTHAYSLDRVDSSKGYVRGNVTVISYLANRLKNNGTAEQHERIAAWMRSMGVE